MPTKTEGTVKESIKDTEKEIEKIAEKLDVKLSNTSLPLPLKIITLIIVAGGLSILGSTLTDFIIPGSGSNILHAYRMLIGLVFLAIAYGLYDRRRWALWLYGIIVFFGIFLNFTLAIVPTLLVIYIYTQRKVLRRGPLDILVGKIFKDIQNKYRLYFNKKTSVEK